MAATRHCLALLLLAGAVHAQQTAAILDAPVVAVPNDSAALQQLLDWDGDGDLDAVGVRPRLDGTEFMLQVWRNDQGAFVEVLRSAFPASNAIYAPIVVEDVDGDGLDDFRVGAGPVLHTFRSLGNGTFAHQQTVSSGVYRALVAADVDADGLRDLVALRRDTTGSNFSALAITWGAGGSTVRTGNLNVDGLLVLDLDGDPQLEVATTHFTGSLFWHDATPAGITFLTGFARTTFSSYPASWVAGDIDGDGDQDLVSLEQVEAPTSRCEVWRRTGPSSWVHEPAYACDPIQVLVDLDGDGDLDGLGSTGSVNMLGFYGNAYQQMLNVWSSFCIAWNDGTGRFTSANWPCHGNWAFAGAVDLDGDGDLDLVSGGCVHYGRGPWSVAPASRTGLPFLPAWRLLDLDRDGDLDLAASKYVALWNRGDGTFEQRLRPGVVWPAGQGFTGEWIEGDFDGDGAPDLISGSGPLLAGQPTYGGMLLLRNNGGGRWRNAGPATAGGLRLGDDITADQDRAGDLDGDGDLDLVLRVGLWLQARSDVFYNDGTGVFTAVTTFPGETCQHIADLDGDGRADLVLTLATQPYGLIVRLGTGNPAQPFGAAIPVSPLAATGTGVADLNDDGRPDLLLVPSSGETLVLTNQTTAPGALQFVAARLDPPLLDPGARLEAADLDGDGRTDLVAGPLRTNNQLTAVWRRTGGTGQVLTAAHFAVSVLAAGPGRLGDADGDGDVDLVGPWLVRNRRFDLPLAPARLQYGVGTPGEDGAAPLLGLDAPLRAGASSSLVLNSIAGPGIAAFALSGQPASIPGVPLPGLTALIDPNVLAVVPVFVGSNGEGRAAAETALALTMPAGSAGWQFFLQAFVLDPAGPSGVAASQGLRVRVGQ